MNFIRLTTCTASLGLLLSSLIALASPDDQRPGIDLDQELTALVALYAGSYMSGPEEGARQSRPILLRVVPVKPPPGHSRALYSEMRHDGAGGELYRQNLLVFDEAPDRTFNSMTALNFVDRDAATKLLDDPAALAADHLATTPGLGQGCAMRFTRQAEGFLGRINPDTCVIKSRNGDMRHIESETFLRRDTIEQLERGYSPEGALLFGNPDGVRYIWPRLFPKQTQP